MGFHVSKTYTFDAETLIGGTMINLPVSADWSADGPNAPEMALENGELVYLFSPLLLQSITLFFKIPQSCSLNKQLTLYGSFYSPSTSGNVLFTANTYLIRRGVDPVSFATNVRVSTNTAITNSSIANQYSQFSLDLTSATGTVNATTFIPGDMLRIVLMRNTDTDSNIVRFIPSATEVTVAS